jgi:hypothetical protein
MARSSASAAATTAWDTEQTDAKGYWVARSGMVEALDFELPSEIVERPGPPGREVASVPMAFEEPSLDVPEFTLSGSKPLLRVHRAAEVAAVRIEPTMEEPLAAWECMDTQVPHDVEDLPTEEAGVAPAPPPARSEERR